MRDLAEVLIKGPGAVLYGPVLDTADIAAMMRAQGVKADLEVRDIVGGGTSNESGESVNAIAPSLKLDLGWNDEKEPT